MNAKVKQLMRKAREHKYLTAVAGLVLAAAIAVPVVAAQGGMADVSRPVPGRRRCTIW